MTERELFVDALALDDPAARDAFLATACPDHAMRRRVQALLARHGQEDPRIDGRPPNLIAGLLDAESQTTELTTNAITGLPAGLLAPSDQPGVLGRLGHYDILEVRGRGGFGIVLRAFDTTLQRVVALKMLDPVLAATSPPRQRFLREARAVAKVAHENVVRVHAVAEEPVPYLVMEYVDGPTLQEAIDKGGPLPAAEVVRLGREIALGLAAAHDQGLIHRDVKPANVLLAGGVERHARLTDFGLARSADDASLTQSGVIAGSPLYMAPEQVRGELLDARADLFALGSLLYTMAAGRPPFRAANTFAVLKRVAEDTPRPLRDVIADVPPGLVAVIERLHAKQPEGRYRTARAVADALATCLTEPGPRPISPARRGWLKVAVPAAVVAGVVAAWFFLQNRGSNPILAERSPATVATIAAPPTPTIPATLAPPPAPPTVPEDPDTAWQRFVATLPAQQQFEAVLSRLKQLNAEYKGNFAVHYVRNGEIYHLSLHDGENLRDISPVRALRTLQGLSMVRGPSVDITPIKGMKLTFFEANGCNIKDLSPLAGMPLKECKLWQFQAKDLSPLQGMQLVDCNLGGSPVNDISVLRGMPLEKLTLNYTEVKDLSPLRGAPLKMLNCQNTQVTDISILAEMPLEELRITHSPIQDYSPLRNLPLRLIELNYDRARHAELLRSIPTLETINNKPAAQFFVDEGI